jgi:hypothetical protein
LDDVAETVRVWDGQFCVSNAQLGRAHLRFK